MQPKIIKSQNDNIFENGRWPQFFENGRQPQFFVNGRRPQQKIMQPKTIKSKDNGCGTAPGNLVGNLYSSLLFS